MLLENEQIIPSLLGTGLFAGLLTWAAYHSTWLWRRIASAYPRPAALAAVRGRMETIIIAERPGATLGEKVAAPFRLHAGVMLSVVDGGLLLSRIFPFNFLCSPVYLPFAEMTIRPTFWALWPEPVAVSMKLLPDTDIILSQEAAQWLREHMA